jgi:DnaD/phage-associated family protein
VRRSQLEGEPPLRRLLDRAGGGHALGRGLDAAVARGVLLSCETADGDSYYFVNNDGGRRQRDRMLAGAIDVPARPVTRHADVTTSRPASVYEAEIGMLTPSVSSALSEMEAKLPEHWIVDAIRLAARRNARSWVYVEAVLRRWEVEGRDDEAAERAADGSGAGTRDPYDHVVRRRFD